MLLTADIGNTNIVLALLDHGDRVVSQRRIPSGEVLPLAAYEDAVRQVLAGHDARRLMVKNIRSFFSRVSSPSQGWAM